MVELAEVEECRVGVGGGINLALHRPPIWGHVLVVGGWGGTRFSSFWLRGGVGAIVSSSPPKGVCSPSITRGEVDGGGAL